MPLIRHHGVHVYYEKALIIWSVFFFLNRLNRSLMDSCLDIRVLQLAGLLQAFFNSPEQEFKIEIYSGKFLVCASKKGL